MIPDKFKDNGFKIHPVGTIVIPDNFDFVFIAVPKNCSSLFYRYLFEGKCQVRRDGESYIKTNRDRIVFTVVRDPVTRFVSGYQEILKYRKDTKDNEVLASMKFSTTRDPHRKFIQFIEDMGDSFVNPHMLPQAKLINPFLSYIDFFFRFEFMKEDISIFNSKYKNSKLKTPLTLVNKCRDKNLKKELIELCRKSKNIMEYLKSTYPDDFKLYEQVNK